MSVETKQTKVANPTYQPLLYSSTGYKSFKSFYPYYLGEHGEPTNRRLHLTGTGLSLGFQTRALLGAVPLLLNKLAQETGAELVKDLAAKSWIKALGLENGWKGVGKVFGQAVLIGYGMAWVGHFFFEKNKPATFKNPFYSLLGDYTMFWEVLTRQRDA